MRKGQSVMEFITYHGWVIITIALIGSIFYTQVFKSQYQDEQAVGKISAIKGNAVYFEKDNYIYVNITGLDTYNLVGKICKFQRTKEQIHYQIIECKP